MLDCNSRLQEKKNPWECYSEISSLITVKLSIEFRPYTHANQMPFSHLRLLSKLQEISLKNIVAQQSSKVSDYML